MPVAPSRHGPEVGDPVVGTDPLTVLRDGELTILGRIPTASNATVVCDAVLGESSLRCVYKPVRGEVPLWDFPDGTLAGREVGSYLVSEALGWSVIPTTVLRDGPVGPGMVQRWIDTPDHLDEELPTPRVDLVDLCPPDALPVDVKPILEAIGPTGEPIVLVHADDPRLLRMAVFDVVINNADRKGGHVLESLDGNVYGVDHGICLHEDDKLRTVLWGWAGEPVPGHLLADLERLIDKLGPDGALRSDLAPHITEAEIDALTLRTCYLVETGTLPEPPESRPIPWPPF